MGDEEVEITNHTVNRYATDTERDLLDDLMAEAIEHTGVNTLYLPRVEDNLDGVYLEDPLHRFERAHQMDMYLENFDSFRGDGHFMDKLGVRITDQVQLRVARKTFVESMRGYDLTRPREGDLVFWEGTLFEIRYVEKWPEVYPMGHLPSWILQCEVFAYNGQRLDTGIPEIDAFAGHLDGADADPTLPDVDPIGNPLDDSGRVEAEADAIIDFSESDPFSAGIY